MTDVVKNKGGRPRKDSLPPEKIGERELKALLKNLNRLTPKALKKLEDILDSKLVKDEVGLKAALDIIQKIVTIQKELKALEEDSESGDNSKGKEGNVIPHPTFSLKQQNKED